MKLLKQKYRHNPPQYYGDCHRTAIAMVRGLERDDVPHFHDCGKSEDDFELHQQWFDDRGIIQVTIPFECDLQTLLANREHYAPKVPYILGCKSEVAHHSVAVYDGEIYNPAIQSTQVNRCDDGYFWVTYLWQKPQVVVPSVSALIA